MRANDIPIVTFDEHHHDADPGVRKLIETGRQVQHAAVDAVDPTPPPEAAAPDTDQSPTQGSRVR
jgi:hypothetical protein